jgi:hypothetical protein
LYSANEVRQLGIQADAEEAFVQYEADAISFGWQPTFDDDGRPSVDGTSWPSIPEGITRLLARGTSGNPGRLLWSRLSAVTHAVWWGLEWAFDLDQVRPAGPGRATVSFGTETAKVAMPALSILRALRTAATDQFTLMGWNEDPSWQSVCRAAEAHERHLSDVMGARLNQGD